MTVYLRCLWIVEEEGGEFCVLSSTMVFGIPRERAGTCGGRRSY